MTEELWREARSDEDDEAVLDSPGHPSDGIGLVQVPARALLIEDADRAVERIARNVYERESSAVGGSWPRWDDLDNGDRAWRRREATEDLHAAVREGEDDG